MGRAAALAALGCVVGVAPGVAQSPKLHGRVVDAVQGRPVPGALVRLLGTDRATRTGSDGGFRLDSLPSGVWRLAVSAIGYRPAVRADVVLAPARSPDVLVRLEPLPVNLAGIVNEPDYFEPLPAAPVSAQVLSNEEIRRLPGGLEDVARAVAVLPGVVQVSEGRNDLIVRGGAPSENLYLIDGIEVENINHFGTQGATGGPLSFVNLDFVRDVTFSTGGFGVPYGDRLSSTLAIELKDGRTDRVGGRATLASSQVGLDLEGPTGGAGSFLLSVRRSYLDLVFRAAGFGFVPEYWDLLGRWVVRPGPRDEVSVFVIGALDNVRFFNETEDQRYDNAQVLGNAQNRYVAGLGYRRVLPRALLDVRVGRTLADYSFIQRDTLLAPVFLSDSRESETALRADLAWQVGAGWDVRLGVQGKLALARGRRIFPSAPVTDFGDSLPTDSAAWDVWLTKGAAYAELAQRTGRFRAAVGVRLDAFAALDAPAVWSPRASFSAALGPRTTLTWSAGVYRQAPAFVWVTANPVNRRLRHARADHLVMGLEHRLRPDLRLRVETYVKRYRDYAASTVRPYLVLANTGAGFGGADDDGFAAFGFDPLVSDGRGTARGVEVLLQKRLSEIPLYGTAALSVARARFTALDGVERPGTYERPVTVTVGGGYRFDPRWEASFKFRFGSGLPYTPFRADGSRDPGAYNTARFPATHALDLRVDRRWTFRAWNLVTYVDVQNVYGRKNVQGIRWDERRGAPEPQDAIGIFPTIGVSAEF
ncbi:MAG: TonB-dependent receptor [Gemmatimonadota bacterium]|nr:TonB-dependent receptor [Gemmatimonadota bacterium]